MKEKQQTSDMGPILHAYLMLARYADSQYQRVTRHMTSTAYETKKQLLEKSQLELEKLSETISKEAQLRNRFKNLFNLFYTHIIPYSLSHLPPDIFVLLKLK